MGTTGSIENLEVWRSDDAEDWVVVENAGYCNVVRNNVTGEVAEQYTVTLDERISVYEEFQRYDYRRRQHQNLVSVLSAYKERNQHICSGGEVARVRTERIPYRLSEVQNLSHAEVLLVLQEAIIGFKTILQRHGAIHLDDNMIGFTPAGRVKVWLTDNFARNTPDDSRFNFDQWMGAPTQHGMISELFRDVEVHSAGKRYPTVFKARFEQERIENFFEAMIFLNEYIEDERIEIPAYVRLPRTMQPMSKSTEQRHINYKIPDIVLKAVPRIQLTAPGQKVASKIATEPFGSRATKISSSSTTDNRQLNVRRDAQGMDIRPPQHHFLKHKSGLPTVPKLVEGDVNVNHKSKLVMLKHSVPSVPQQGSMIRLGIKQEAPIERRRQKSLERIRTLPNEPLKEIVGANSRPLMNGMNPNMPSIPAPKAHHNQNSGLRTLDRLVAQRR